MLSWSKGSYLSFHREQEKKNRFICFFSSVQSHSRVRLSATPWTETRQASLSITNSRSSLRLTSIESVMPSSHLILRRPLLLLPPIPPSIRVFSNLVQGRLERPWLNQNLAKPQARGPYCLYKSSGGSCGISDELINMERASVQWERMPAIYQWTPRSMFWVHLVTVFKETKFQKLQNGRDRPLKSRNSRKIRLGQMVKRGHGLFLFCC